MLVVRTGKGTDDNPYVYPFKLDALGRINAKSGEIGGWSVTDSTIYSETTAEGIIKRFTLQNILSSIISDYEITATNCTVTGEKGNFTVIGAFNDTDDASATKIAKIQLKTKVNLSKYSLNINFSDLSPTISGTIEWYDNTDTCLDFMEFETERDTHSNLYNYNFNFKENAPVKSIYAILYLTLENMSVQNGIAYPIEVILNSSTGVPESDVFSVVLNDTVNKKVTHPFFITDKGAIFANKITVDGGTVGGWTINSTRIKSSPSVHMGREEAGLLLINEPNAPFIVANDANGKLTFVVDRNGKVSLTGNITATSGSIGGWVIDSTRIKSSASVHMGAKEAGLMLINETTAPYIVVNNANGEITFQVNRDGGVSLRAGITADSITAKNTYYIHSSSGIGTKRDAMSAVDANFGTALTIGNGFDTLYLKGLIVAGKSADVLVGADGTWSLTCGQLYTASTRVKYKYWFTDAYTQEKAITATGKDGAGHDLCHIDADGLTCYYGWAGSTAYKTVTIVRGQTVRYKNASGTTTLSDERLKHGFKSLDEYDEVYMDINPCAFQYNAGASGRYHFGASAQQVKLALEKHGFTTHDFAGLVQTEDNPGSEDYCGVPDPWGLIYTEFAAWNMHMTQKAIKKIRSQEEEIDKLKSQIAELQKLLRPVG